MALILLFRGVLGVGLGTAAFVAFIATKTNKAYTGAQFTLDCISGLPRTFANNTGYLIADMGYTGSFLLCTGLALGMMLLFKVAPWNAKLRKRRAKRRVLVKTKVFFFCNLHIDLFYICLII